MTNRCTRLAFAGAILFQLFRSGSVSAACQDNVNVQVRETTDSYALISWTPPKDSSPDARFEIWVSETAGYCEYFQKPEPSVLWATVTGSSYRLIYNVNARFVYQAEIRPAGCPGVTYNHAHWDNFGTPSKAVILGISSPSGQPLISYKLPDSTAAYIELIRVGMAGYDGDGPKYYPDFCPTQNTQTFVDNAPFRFGDPAGAYRYYIWSGNDAVADFWKDGALSEPYCMKRGCSDCDCSLTVKILDPMCTAGSAGTCTEDQLTATGPITPKLQKLLSAAPRTGVAIDGVTDLVVTARWITNDNLQFRLVDAQGQLLGPEWGTLLPLYSDVGGGNYFFASSETGYTIHDGMTYAFARYRPPKVLPDSGNLPSASKVFIEASIWTSNDDASDARYRLFSDLKATMPIQLWPPPVILVHGVWSGPESWFEFGKHLVEKHWPLCQGCFADYSRPNPAPSFDPILKDSETVMSAVDQAVRAAKKDYRSRGIAVTQVDAVGHSMGGLVLRARTVFAARPYKNRSNRFQGDFHKIITVGSPHHGSELANWLIRHKDDPLFPSTLGSYMSAFGRSLGPAVYGFQTGSKALQHLGATDVSAHAIIGIAPSPPSSTEKWLNDIPWSVGDTSTTVSQLLGGDGHHDTIVPIESQQGALSSPNSSQAVGYVHTAISSDDTAETESLVVWAEVLAALSDPVTGNQFGHFPAWHPPADDLAVEPTSHAPGTEQKTSAVVATGGGVTTPAPGTIVHPGDVVPVSVTVSGQAHTTDVILSIGGRQYQMTGSNPYTYVWRVPAGRYGRFPIEVLIIGDQSGLGTPSNVLVMPVNPPTELAVSPSDLLLSAIGDTAILTATVSSSSDSEANASYGDAGTVYHTDKGSSVVAVNADGIVTAVASGADVITVMNGGLSTKVPVVVALTNRAPGLAPMSDEVVAAGGERDVAIKATDPDGDHLVISGINLPSFAALSDNGDGTALLRIRPTLNDVGSYAAALAVSDSGNPTLGGSATFTITVTLSSTRHRAVGRP
jgi:hypothetical protein